MKLFLISQSENTNYDTYDSAIVAAPDEDTARGMDPNTGKNKVDWSDKSWSDWCSSPEAVKVEYIGEAEENIKQGVICSSFNAG